MGSRVSLGICDGPNCERGYHTTGGERINHMTPTFGSNSQFDVGQEQFSGTPTSVRGIPQLNPNDSTHSRESAKLDEKASCMNTTWPEERRRQVQSAVARTTPSISAAVSNTTCCSTEQLHYIDHVQRLPPWVTARSRLTPITFAMLTLFSLAGAGSTSATAQ
ncbi:uncharacterized protein FOMMEDRAFT_162957 [Fomitiporia mediterranea MF3/22]|uniref:Uncharacterized protein n=1 Tax=Fomitiporia mediterranea (strain MF3/22) TaxID=694068 RepID=R7SFP1_FOMME|nr:uncharacterized protein FOMMEDRAFT_162957 [Fomitiporia mediterranea MF3/22]EJC97528.1 hypothetical protein FOMMEDRAFT_162957 [Fomitiporia mediterranea MF3/22]